MDGFTGSKTATSKQLPDAVTVMDRFHTVRLAGDPLDAPVGAACSKSCTDTAAGPKIRCTGPGRPCTPGTTCLPRSTPHGCRPCSPSTSTSRTKPLGRLPADYRRLPP
jgi:Transposase